MSLYHFATLRNLAFAFPIHRYSADSHATSVLGIPLELKETFDKVGGSGFGLFYAKRYLENCGAAIRLDTDLGKGTTVTITFPPNGKPSKPNDLG